MIDLPRLQGRDRLLIFLTALAGGILLAVIPHAVSGPEATFAQSLREMRQSGQWLIPTIAGRAQPDMPPLPQWCGLLLGSFIPDADPLVLIRISAALAAAAAVAITSELTASLRGRSAGIMAAALSLTSFGFILGVWQAGGTVWFALMSVLVLSLRLTDELQWAALQSAGGLSHCDHLHARSVGLTSRLPRGWRSSLVAGLASLASGHWIAVIALLPVLLIRTVQLERGWRRTSIGVLTVLAGFAAGGLLHPVLAESVHPGFLRGQILQAGGLMTGLAGVTSGWSSAIDLLTPWGLLIPVGLYATRHEALGRVQSPERLVWMFGLLGPLMLILISPGRLPLCAIGLGAWSCLAVLGLKYLEGLATLGSKWLAQRRIERLLMATAGASCLVLLWRSEQQASGDLASLQVIRNLLPSGSQVRVEIQEPERLAMTLNELASQPVTVVVSPEPADSGMAFPGGYSSSGTAVSIIRAGWARPLEFVPVEPLPRVAGAQSSVQ